jgi:hypothetical protein
MSQQPPNYPPNDGQQPPNQGGPYQPQQPGQYSPPQGGYPPQGQWQGQQPPPGFQNYPPQQQQGYYPGAPQQPPRPPKKGGVPVWGWIVGGIVGLLVVFGIIGTLAKPATTTVVSVATATVAAAPTTQASGLFAATTAPAVPSSTTVAAANAVQPTARPTATTRPTATPRPTAVPTATPNVTATANAKAAATSTAGVNATAGAQATIAALPKPLDFSGSGDKVLQNIKLNQGLARLTMTNSGDDNFAVKFMDTNGTLLDLAANVIGNYKGSRFVPVAKTGDYVLEISGGGNWKINIVDIALLQQEAPVAPPLKGHGPAALLVQIDKNGLNVFKMSHKGEDNFAVSVLSPKNGTTQGLLANEIGTYNGEKSQRFDKGVYPFNVDADGDWTIEVS